jgi:hypothetical protein
MSLKAIVIVMIMPGIRLLSRQFKKGLTQPRTARNVRGARLVRKPNLFVSHGFLNIAIIFSSTITLMIFLECSRDNAVHLTTDFSLRCLPESPEARALTTDQGVTHVLRSSRPSPVGRVPISLDQVAILRYRDCFRAFCSRRCQVASHNRAVLSA